MWWMIYGHLWSVLLACASFGLQTVLSGFTKDSQGRISLTPDLIEYAFVGVSLSDEIIIQMNHATRFTNVCTRQTTLFLSPKKACLELFWALQRTVEGRGFFHSYSFHLECQKNTLSEHIICEVMLFYICFRKAGVTQHQLYQNLHFYDLRFFSTYRGFFISFIASLCLVYCVDLSLKHLNRMFSTTLINTLEEWA